MDLNAINARFAAAFGESATYYKSPSEAVTLRLVRYQEPVDATYGQKGSSRQSIAFEISIASLSTRPDNGDRIACADGDWFVKSASDLDIDGQWYTVVERAPTKARR